MSDVFRVQGGDSDNRRCLYNVMSIVTQIAESAFIYEELVVMTYTGVFGQHSRLSLHELCVEPES
jgi:hypothetical protein